MKATYSVARAQASLPKILRVAEDRIVTITRRDEKVAYLISTEQLESLIESLEIMSNPEAMKLLRKAKTGKVKCYPLPKDLDNEG